MFLFSFLETLEKIPELLYNKYEVNYMDSYSIIILIFGLLIFSILIVIFLVNQLLLKRKKVELQFETIIKILKTKMELIDKMVAFINDNLEHEEVFVRELKRTKSALEEINISSKENIKTIKKSEKTLAKFNQLATVYPFLKSKATYNDLTEAYALIQNRITYAMDSYDRAAKTYNAYLSTKINMALSKTFKIDGYSYYND